MTNSHSEDVSGELIETYEHPGELPRGCRVGNPDLEPGTYALVRIDDAEEYARTFERMLGHETEIETYLPEFGGQYEAAYQAMEQHLDDMGVWLCLEAADLDAYSFLLAAIELRRRHPTAPMQVYRTAEDGTPALMPLPTIDAPPSETGVAIPNHLSENGTYRSVSELARNLADGECDPSFRSRVQYNVKCLTEDGYIEPEADGNRLSPRLSRMGELWVQTHD